MNDNATPAAQQTYETFVWRRLEEPLKVFNTELPWEMWLVLLGVVLAVALFYVGWMYTRDAKGVGAWWATFLGLCRTSVYIVLSIVFLLPAQQTYVETKSESKVMIAVDISGSVQTSDRLPTGAANEKLVTRMDQVLEFMGNPKVDFLPALEKKNPVTFYRFGTRLDEDYFHLADGRVWTRDERENKKRDDNGAWIKPEPGPLPMDAWAAWLQPGNKLPDPINLKEFDRKRMDYVAERNLFAVRENLSRGTNIGDSLIALINREINNRPQGIILFTDGRNTEGTADAFTRLSAMAKSARVPIFVVAVGEDRQKVKIEIADALAPAQIAPEDKFRVKADVTGEGLPGEKLDVTLELAHIRTTKSKDKEGKVVEKEDALPIYLVEVENPENPMPASAREKITLGDKIVMKPLVDTTLDKSTPPRAEVEWQLDAAALAAAAKVDLNDPKYKGRKWEIGETLDDSELKFQVKVPVDKREVVAAKLKTHESNRLPTKVVKKPLRILLVAAAANRDYQFVRTMLVREMDKKRMELAIHLQIPPGQEKYREGVVQDLPPNRLLTKFPDTYQKTKDLYDLSSYDVIVAFDPDWRQISSEEVKHLKSWSDKGGGLVLIGGHINTVELVKLRDGDDADRFKPILEMIPVILDDRRDSIDRKSEEPFTLDFEGASPELEFLRLDEELDATKFKEDWTAFFYGTGMDKSDKPVRGFYSFYPVQKAKAGSVVVARFTDPTARLKDNSLHPYMVLSPESLARVVWLGSAETWRLREYREEYHERFWTKLVRYAGAKSKGGAIRPIRLEAPTSITAGRNFEVAAKIDGPDGQPLSRNVKPRITLKMPPGVPDSDIRQPIEMSPRPGSNDGWFSGRFLVRTAGDYEMIVTVPKQPGGDSDQTETAKFTVKEANPEQDNTRPDYDRMYRLASEADEVLPRMADADKTELRRRLSRPKLDAAAPKDGDTVEIREDKPRLYFDLRNADLIPSCMKQDIQSSTSRGRHKDLWDDGFVIYEYPPPADETQPAKPPVKIAYVLLVVVGLLSVEWLTRKLLRLA